MEDDEHMIGGGDEAKVKMEAKKLRNLEKQKEEMAEYEEMRKAEREKDEEEIKQLRLRREQRKKERVEENKKMAGQMKIEEARRRGEEDQKKKQKKEEEHRKKEEREKKKKEAEERLKPKKPNYVIAKKSGEGGEGSESKPTSKEDMQKSKEQLEEEKKAILAQRLPPLDISSMDIEKLKEKAKEFHDHLRKLAGDKFDYEENYKRQQKDLIELAERARQMSKGKGKKTGSDIQRVDDSFDKLADKYAGCPPKIMLHSKYERLTDHRNYDERKDLYSKIIAEIEEAQEEDRKIRDHMKEMRGANPVEGGEAAAEDGAVEESAEAEEEAFEEAPAAEEEEEAPAAEEEEATFEEAADEVAVEA